LNSYKTEENTDVNRSVANVPYSGECSWPPQQGQSRYDGTEKTYRLCQKHQYFKNARRIS